MAETRLRYPLLWIGFVIVMIAGATMVSAGGTWVWVGLVLFTAPMLAIGALAFAYYLRQRKRPEQPPLPPN